MTYEFTIKISGLSEPSVWRRLVVPANYTFFQFHKIIQIAFGWENLHYFEFYDKNENTSVRIFMPLEEDTFHNDNARKENAIKTKLSDIFNKDTKSLLYLYDRNDRWIHEITVEKVTEDVIPCPECLCGEGMCPPEGCDGPKGYEYIKNILLNDPDNDNAPRLREWLFLEDDDIFDPTYFPKEELKEINEYLHLFAK